jgi:hypothetical protein
MGLILFYSLFTCIQCRQGCCPRVRHWMLYRSFDTRYSRPERKRDEGEEIDSSRFLFATTRPTTFPESSLIQRCLLFQSLNHWKNFFKNHKDYPLVGRVVHEPIDPSSPLPGPCSPAPPPPAHPEPKPAPSPVPEAAPRVVEQVPETKHVEL